MLYYILKINILLYLILNWEYFPVPGEVNWVDLEAWDILLMLLKCEKYLNDCLTSKKYHNIDLEGKSGLTQSEFGLISTMQSIIWFTVWKSTVFSGSRKKLPPSELRSRSIKPSSQRDMLQNPGNKVPERVIKCLQEI